MTFDGFDDVSKTLRCGVYILVARGQVIYIGKAKSMLARLNTHRRKWADKRKGNKLADFIPIPGLLFDEVHIRPCTIETIDALEREMIDRYKPKYNIKLQTRTISAPIRLVVGGRELMLNTPPPAPKSERRI